MELRRPLPDSDFGEVLALVQACDRAVFRRFHAQGERAVALGVDVENSTSAARLYERAGMHVLWQADVWWKDLGHGG